VRGSALGLAGLIKAAVRVQLTQHQWAPVVAMRFGRVWQVAGGAIFYQSCKRAMTRLRRASARRRWPESLGELVGQEGVAVGKFTADLRVRVHAAVGDRSAPFPARDGAVTGRAGRAQLPLRDNSGLTGRNPPVGFGADCQHHTAASAPRASGRVGSAQGRTGPGIEQVPSDRPAGVAR